MFKYLISVDMWVVKKFESLSRWTQVWAGITAFMWAKYMLRGATIGVVWALCEAPHWGMRVLDGLILLAFIGRNYTLEPPKEPKDGVMYINPHKWEDIGTRLGSLIASPVIVLMAVVDLSPFILWPLCASLHWYFMACDPYPPSKSKLRSFVESLSHSTSLQPQQGEL